MYFLENTSEMLIIQATILKPLKSQFFSPNESLLIGKLFCNLSYLIRHISRPRFQFGKDVPLFGEFYHPFGLLCTTRRENVNLKPYMQINWYFIPLELCRKEVNWKLLHVFMVSWGLKKEKKKKRFNKT